MVASLCSISNVFSVYPHGVFIASLVFPCGLSLYARSHSKEGRLTTTYQRDRIAKSRRGRAVRNARMKGGMTALLQVLLALILGPRFVTARRRDGGSYIRGLANSSVEDDGQRRTSFLSNLFTMNGSRENTARADTAPVPSPPPTRHRRPTRTSPPTPCKSSTNSSSDTTANSTSGRQRTSRESERVAVCEASDQKSERLSVCNANRKSQLFALCETDDRKPELFAVCKANRKSERVSVFETEDRKPELFAVCKANRKSERIPICEASDQKSERLSVCKANRKPELFAVCETDDGKPELVTICKANIKGRGLGRSARAAFR